MNRRTAWALSVLMAVLVLGGSPPALAWSNGVNGYNSYGTQSAR